MKKLVRKAFVCCTIFTVAAFSLNISASAACPLTSLFSLGKGNSLLSSNSCRASNILSGGGGNILSRLFGNSNSANTNTQNTTGSCNSGSQASYNISDILQKYYNKNNNTTNSCPTGNCTTNNCPDGNCATNTCPDGNCATNTCPDGNCATETCPDGNCETVGGTYAEELLYYVNIARAENNLPRLTLNTKLNNAAEIRAKETVTSFSHTRPNGTSFSTVLKEVGITYNTCGENIAYGYPTAEKVFNGWMNSPGHKANILNAKFTYMGIGKYNNNWAQLFMS